ncbi:hypothetical protein IAT38_004059 [Cryptococcus sp. DSM 104549]
MSDALIHPTQRLSLHPNPALSPARQSTSRTPSRDSTVESTNQAADIFDLYGADTTRDSWRSDRTGDDTTIDEVEELKSADRERESWAGPLGALSSWEGDSEGARYPSGQTVGDQSGERRQRWSALSNGTTPDISITDTSPHPPASTQDTSTPASPTGPHTPNRTSRAINPHLSHISTTSASSASTNNSPARLSSSGLSPRHASTRPTSSASRSTDMFSEGGHGANKSQTSVAGSVQYPGEDNDAFYVRSTYARLEGEGVHGDGWDAGVERTRGGPTPASKRATVFPASKSGDIGQQERQFLASLDRYGFVNDPHRHRSESRIASIPSEPLRKFPRLPNSSPLAGQPPAEPTSSFSPSNDAGPSPKIPSSPRLDGNEDARTKRKESERVGKWEKMMKVQKRDTGGNIVEWGWDKDGQGTKLNKRVYKGIPDRWRMAAWWTLAQEQSRSWRGKGKGKRTAQELSDDYQHAIDHPSTFDVQIDLDVPRTISGHTMFVTRYGAGQRNLWHVLHCFSQVCETCGYVQGMGPIAATLLCYFDPERAYALLVRLHDVYGMHDIFEPGFPGLLEAFYVQERLMEWMMPDLYQSFQRNMISSSAWGTKWYITLFVNTVPFSQQLRLWDVLWLEGRDTMIITSLAILWAFRDLLSAPNASFESILSLLSSYFVAEDDDVLVAWIQKVLGNPAVRRKMDGWREEWKGLVASGKSVTALL